MAEKYEVVVAGAGHNGLMAGAYLAKAGVNVCVVEHQDQVGGGVITREATIPGFCSSAKRIHCSNVSGPVGISVAPSEPPSSATAAAAATKQTSASAKAAIPFTRLFTLFIPKCLYGIEHGRLA